MHRTLAFALAGCALAVSACADSPTAARSTTARAAAAPSLDAAAANRTYNDIRAEVGMPIRVPCSRVGMEIVPLSGVEHASLQFSQTATGTMRLRMHVNAQGVPGIGLVSGDTYRASGTTEESYDLDPAGAPEGYYLTYTFNVTSAGATGNVVAHEVLLMSYDAFGYPSLDVVKLDAECR